MGDHVPKKLRIETAPLLVWLVPIPSILISQRKITTSVIWVTNTNSSSMISVPISVSINVFVSQPMAVHLPALPPPPQANSFALASQSVVPVVLLSLLHLIHQSTRIHLPMISAITHQIVIALSAP